MRFHIHWHRVVRDTRLHLYLECRCGHRKIRRLPGSGYQPVDSGWVLTGEWAEYARPKR